MTSATGEIRSGGFTLFEILVVLAIIALFTGFFMLRFDDGETEEALTRASTDLKAAALKAKKRAYAFRRDQFIVFSRSGFLLTERLPQADAFGPRIEETDGPRFFREPYRIPGGVVMEYMPPGETKWTREPRFVWTFRSSGLSDPLKVRFSKGRSYSRLDFNVLTGLAEEETMIE